MMKALTLWQPWASLVVGGWKTLETRSWETGHRGPLAIHASKRAPAWCKELWGNEHFCRCLCAMGYPAWAPLPHGVILGYVQLVEIFRAEQIREQVGVMERQFGDFSFGRFAWFLKSPVRFATPIPARGHQRLWNWEPPEDLIGIRQELQRRESRLGTESVELGE